jgi:hypothetical protein
MPHEIVRQLIEQDHPLASLAAMSEAECREELKKTWSALDHPANKAVAKYILSLPSLCLSNTETRDWWLTFYASDAERVSIVGSMPGQILPPLEFPMNAIPGLREFLTRFSGVTDFYLPPGSHFCRPSDLRVMWNSDEQSAWGNVEAWDGSLVIYQGGTGDVIVVRKDGCVGKWHHEFAFSSEEDAAEAAESAAAMSSRFGYKISNEEKELYRCPVLDLKYDFAHLISLYPDYCRLREGSERKQESPFYY